MRWVWCNKSKHFYESVKRFKSRIVSDRLDVFSGLILIGFDLEASKVCGRKSWPDTITVENGISEIRQLIQPKQFNTSTALFSGKLLCNSIDSFSVANLWLLKSWPSRKRNNTISIWPEDTFEYKTHMFPSFNSTGTEKERERERETKRKFARRRVKFQSLGTLIFRAIPGVSLSSQSFLS